VRIDLAAEDTRRAAQLRHFCGSASLGTTDLQTQTYLQYQLQENPARNDLKLDRIADCVVIINVPSESHVCAVVGR
jgi:hypothetical protein